VNGPWLLGYSTAAQNPAPAITRTGAIGRGYRSLPFAAPVRARVRPQSSFSTGSNSKRSSPWLTKGRRPTCLRASSTSSASTMRQRLLQVLLCDFADPCDVDGRGVGEHDVRAPASVGHRGVEPVAISLLTAITLHTGDVLADFLDRLAAVFGVGTLKLSNNPE
jgi:hypothetical protein